MNLIADLHLHSKYARACSPRLTLLEIDAVCRQKGVDIVATGDFTYPAWFAGLRDQLEELNDSGLYKLKTAVDDKIKFLLSTEIALIYKQGDKTRRLHIVLHAPNLRAVKQLNNFLDKTYNIRSDGRPILGMHAPDLVKLCLEIDPRFLIYPAHIWTPWFSVFGSKSGFDTLEECFSDTTEHIFAIETGLSSDPAMNWRLSALDNLTILSNSDAHSLPNIGREANVFDFGGPTMSYDALYNAIKNKDLKQLKYTIEFYPEEGMYHYDGHRACQISFAPAQTQAHQGLCPKCRKPLTIGVMNRVEQLADRPSPDLELKDGFWQSCPRSESYQSGRPYKKLVELDKIIAEALGVKNRQAKQVVGYYQKLLKIFSSELNILLKVKPEDLIKVGLPLIAAGIERMRHGRLNIEPGFDGQYGAISIFQPEEINLAKQTAMF